MIYIYIFLGIDCNAVRDLLLQFIHTLQAVLSTRLIFMAQTCKAGENMGSTVQKAVKNFVR